MDSLVRRMTRAQRPSSRTNGNIIAIGDLKNIWTRNELQNLLLQPLTEMEISFAQECLLRTISLLVYVRAPHASQIIRGLIDEENPFDDTLHKVEAENLNLNLNELTMDFFFAARPLFTAAVLTEGEDMILEGVQGMPLIGSVEPLGHGMNGIVTGHTIPPGHLKSGDNSNPEGVLVAVKSLQKDSDNARREIYILQKLRNLLRDTEIQICSCLTTVTERSEVHSLSLRATGNLRNVLSRLQTDGRAGSLHRGRLMECMQQFKGIVEAVVFLHNSESNGRNTCYCHFDIKPENILVFDSVSSIIGKWQLIDFGITTISDKKYLFWTDGGAREEGTYPHFTITVGTTAKALASRYQPPEIISNIHRLERGESGTFMGRGSDVWSLACVFAELVAANMGGLDDLERKTRHFFYEEVETPWICPGFPGDSGYRRHHSFNRWLENLRRQGKSEPALKICRELIAKMTHIKRIRRLKSQQVLERMERLLELRR
ncbi:kinase-like domain-containing protein [Xylaria cubensis]|nr:kinase-like domain-containing protein [Xylaria cubensis]